MSILFDSARMHKLTWRTFKAQWKFSYIKDYDERENNNIYKLRETFQVVFQFCPPMVQNFLANHCSTATVS